MVAEHYRWGSRQPATICTYPKQAEYVGSISGANDPKNWVAKFLNADN